MARKLCYRFPFAHDYLEYSITVLSCPLNPNTGKNCVALIKYRYYIYVTHLHQIGFNNKVKNFIQDWARRHLFMSKGIPISWKLTDNYDRVVNTRWIRIGTVLSSGSLWVRSLRIDFPNFYSVHTFYNNFCLYKLLAIKNCRWHTQSEKYISFAYVSSTKEIDLKMANLMIIACRTWYHEWVNFFTLLAWPPFC